MYVAKLREIPPTQFWLGLFLVLSSGQYLTNLITVTAYPTRQLQVGAALLGLTGVALLAAGGLVLQQGLAGRAARITLGAAAVFFALVDLYPLVVYGNPLRLATGPVGTTVAALGLLGSLSLLAAALWLAVAIWRPRAGEHDLVRPALVLLAAIAFQKAAVPLVRLLVNLAANPEAVSALARFSLVSLTANLMPTLIRALGAAAGLTALWLTLRRPERGGPAGLAGLAVALWAAADLLLVAALWSSWSSGLSTPPPFALRLRTVVLITLPALALLALSWAVNRSQPLRT